MIVATQNKGKLKEIKNILKGINIPIISLAELDKKFRIREDRKTFLENALKKALPVSKVYRDDCVIGEDSGLEVEYLAGAPGVYSKRHSGKNATDQKNNFKILDQLQGVTGKQRKAWFKCCLALVKNGKLLKAFEGKLNGRISYEIKGSNGFGYDPVFYIPKYRKTAAEISMEDKNKISHRAEAFSKLRAFLKKNN